MCPDQGFFSLDWLGNRAADAADACHMEAGNVGLLGVFGMVKPVYTFHRNHPRPIDRRHAQYDERIYCDLNHAAQRIRVSSDL